MHRCGKMQALPVNGQPAADTAEANVVLKGDALMNFNLRGLSGALPALAVGALALSAEPATAPQSIN